ncbi:MAG: cytochrome c oxidase accessory protein FixG [Alphaproteobacteria bacterium]|jgi:cytochrome c oxidase accessory protein FixG
MSEPTTMIRSDQEPEVETVAVKAVNRVEERSLYAKHQKIYPRRTQGTFRRLKWVIMLVTLGIYYGAPWLRWERGTGLPDQAILLDFPSRRFYFFFIEIWPDEVYYLTGLLILAALVLFLVTSIAGRVWCGYMCPQTVWVDLFLVVERAIEGDRNARIRLDRRPWGVRKVARKVLKHGIWLMIAVATGGAWVFYFADAPVLAGQLVRLEAPATSYVFIALFTATTYLLGGIAREQVCIYMCPWPRIQAGLQDEQTLTVSYHPLRGEARGPHKRGEAWEGRGDCVDCNQCVVVCPMGIDIRDGPQLECISCALCIDACNTVMDKVDRPRGLVGYDTMAGVEQGSARPKLIRPRTVLYAAIIVIVGGVMLATLMTRAKLDVSIARDRNPLFVQLTNGSVRNSYTLKILNKHLEARRYRLTVEGIEGAQFTVFGTRPGPDGVVLKAAPDRQASYRIYVTVGALVAGGTSALHFVLADRESGEVARYQSSFRGPGQ